MKMTFPSTTHLKKVATHTQAHFYLLYKFTTLTETENASSECKYAIQDLQVYTILKNLGQNNFSYSNTIICM